MLTSPPAALLVLALLVGALASAQPGAVACETGTRRIELKTERTGEEPGLCIRPELSTTLLFYGAELSPEGVSVDGRERFTLVEVSNTMLRLVPSERVVPGERLRLTLRFKGTDAPVSAALWLVVSAGQVAALVEVYREKRTVESYQQEVKEKDTQLRQCQEGNEQLRAEQGNPGGLAGLLATGLMNTTGVASKSLAKTVGEHPGNVFRLIMGFSYRSFRRVAVELNLKASGKLPPWRAVKAELVGPGHRMLHAYPIWQQEPLGLGVEDWRVVIEAQAPESETRGSFTLKIWNEDGTQSITLTGVTFP